MWKQMMAGLVLVAAATPALAGQCPALMGKVDRKLGDEAVVSGLSQSELERVRELRAQGEKFHNSGRHGKSVEVLNEALSILGEGGGSGY